MQNCAGGFRRFVKLFDGTIQNMISRPKTTEMKSSDEGLSFHSLNLCAGHDACTCGGTPDPDQILCWRALRCWVFFNLLVILVLYFQDAPTKEWILARIRKMESRSSTGFLCAFSEISGACKIVSAEMIEIPARCPPQFLRHRSQGNIPEGGAPCRCQPESAEYPPFLRTVGPGDFEISLSIHREIIAQTGNSLCQGGPFANAILLRC